MPANSPSKSADAIAAGAVAYMRTRGVSPNSVVRPGSPADFAEYASRGKWTRPPHLALLNDALLAVAAGEIRRLIVEMPPRHGKSELTSRYFPSWFLGTYPDRRIILTSYEATFARSWGRKARELLEAYGTPLFGNTVRRGSAAADDWTIEGHEGGMITAGVGGAITGRGADVLLVDDPVKNAEEAASPVIQERNWDWWRSTAYTRLEPDGAAVVIGTRWHEADLIGRILSDEDQDEEWTVVKLPALAEPDDMLGRSPGEALWPERYNADRLERIRKRIGSYYFAALYQQTPTPEAGGIFDRSWWHRYQLIPLTATRKMGFLDTAQVDKPGSDYSALATWCFDGKEMFVKDMRRGRFTFPELMDVCLDWYNSELCPLVIEETPWCLPLIQSLEKAKLPVIRYKIEGHSKIDRARAVSPYVEAGLVSVPRSASWVGDFIEEHAAFPNGMHDDQVDTTSMAMMRLMGFGVPDFKSMKQDIPWPGEEKTKRNETRRGM